jgi:hypothetical protein
MVLLLDDFSRFTWVFFL